MSNGQHHRRRRRRRNRPPRQGGQNQQGRNAPASREQEASSRLTLANVFTALSGIFVGLMLFTFSIASSRGRDTLIGLAITLVFLLLLITFALRLPGVSYLWKSFRGTFLKKRAAAFERYLWSSGLIGIGVYLFLCAIRALGS